MEPQTDARILRTIECYLSELLCNAKTMDEVNLVAEALVAVQSELAAMERGNSYAA